MNRSQRVRGPGRGASRQRSKSVSAPDRLAARRPAVLAVAAHPDDIELYMAGTLLLLGRAGFAVHYLTLANGSCGSATMSAATTVRTRRRESMAAADILGAQFHEPLVNDLEIFYELKLLRRLAALVRRANPSIVLTHSPEDYMEDHVNCCRLALTAAFTRGMPNFTTCPAAPVVGGEVTVYHAMPHGLRDPLRARVVPGAFVNTTSVHRIKRRALSAHRSQKEWLDASQGMDSYLLAMDEMSATLGTMSRRFRHAEGWRRHLHYGFGRAESDPLAEVLGSNYFVNSRYEQQLEIVAR